MNTHILDQTKFALFMGEDLSVKESKLMLPQINQRIFYIIETMMAAYGYSTDWADIDVDDYEDKDKDDDDFLFDVHLHANEIPFLGRFIPNQNCKIEIYDIHRVFPTSWLYKDFTSELEQMVALDFELIEKRDAKKNKELQEILAVENELAEAKEKILKILPKELLQYISFVTPSQLSNHKASLKKQKEVLVAQKVRDLKKSGIVVSDKFNEYRLNGGTQTFPDWLMENYP